ncbi:hypothetical protein V2G26_021102 [Clonostachys chloroleuca]|uniref:Nucleotide-diphospho-sugar transferase domain-containing protein n=1 Tax=Clonostachys chloroleuca TaxID=1926264 RepID=A0AA35LVB8_9HYPO|nr:unnamed protein product [Clonostachys chloroleuca]
MVVINQYALGRWGTAWGFRIAAAASILVLFYLALSSSLSKDLLGNGHWTAPSPNDANSKHTAEPVSSSLAKPTEIPSLDSPAAPTSIAVEVPASSTAIIEQPKPTFTESTHVNKNLDLPALLAQLWKPKCHPLENPVFITNEGVRFEIPPNQQIWKKPLGNKVVVIDVDTRVSEENENTLLNPNPFDFSKLGGRTGGHLNHYLYALIHGYDYRLIKAGDYPDRHGTWVKVSILKEALKTHDYVVFLDADAVITHLELPIEWLMNLWDYKPHTLIAMAEDLDIPPDYDPQGKIILNTGFLIAQASERTSQMMDMWETCPEKIEGCNHWKHNWAHEQSAFSYYIRYNFTEPDEVRNIPCAHANGNEYYEEGKGACRGHFVSHNWQTKEKTVTILQRSVMRMLVDRLHSQFKDEQHTLFVNGSSVPYPIQELHI